MLPFVTATRRTQAALKWGNTGETDAVVMEVAPIFHSSPLPQLQVLILSSGIINDQSKPVFVFLLLFVKFRVSYDCVHIRYLPRHSGGYTT